MLDTFFGGLRWYRKYRKGTWYYVFIKAIPLEGWIHREPSQHEVILHSEDWG